VYLLDAYPHCFQIIFGIFQFAFMVL
jgi:hypothetical protein